MGYLGNRLTAPKGWRYSFGVVGLWLVGFLLLTGAWGIIATLVILVFLGGMCPTQSQRIAGVVVTFVPLYVIAVIWGALSIKISGWRRGVAVLGISIAPILAANLTTLQHILSSTPCLH